MNEETPWLQRTIEAVIEPALPICDPHHHLWVHPTSRYQIDEFLSDVNKGHNILKTLYVECSQYYNTSGSTSLKPVGETVYIDKLTQNCTNPIIAAGIIGFADMMLGLDVADVLDAHMQASDRFRGVRHSAAWHESDKIHNAHSRPFDHILLNKDFRLGLSCLEKRQLSFDAWIYFTQIPDLIDLANAMPELTIILNHVGGPIGIGPYANQRTEVFEHWQANMRLLAQCPNVVVKLGGLTMTMAGFGWHKQLTPPSSSELALALSPYFKFCIEQFGADRCMFESNFPMDKVSGSYTILWNAFKRLSAEYSTHERAALFYDTACKIYKV